MIECINYLPLTCFILLHVSVFFSDRLASERSANVEVLEMTPLLMPANPSFKSFTTIINQVREWVCCTIYSMMLLCSVVIDILIYI